MGYTGRGPHGVQTELQNSSICGPSTGSPSGSNGRTDHSVGRIQTPVRISTNSPHTKNSVENQTGRATRDINSARLAKKKLVRGHHRNVD
ncbi:hypothetical protein GDO78_018076 [Eleutherodactylus coqui]|uniref:Uncharacterized protein n=1 Tax=Eleutherodactylus coqui TaxID=57060 RepID=A0A8J6BDN5_ELECQ|nr:hypothetical protein GDO78_018076 [Eleutherodactylus coqui]